MASVCYTDGSLTEVCYVIENVPCPEWTVVSVNGLTVNQAEYAALVHALTRVRRLGLTEVTIYADSELMVKQLNGDYRTRDPELKALQVRVKEAIPQDCKVSFVWLPRNKNKAGLILEGKRPSLVKGSDNASKER